MKNTWVLVKNRWVEDYFLSAKRTKNFIYVEGLIYPKGRRFKIFGKECGVLVETTCSLVSVSKNKLTKLKIESRKIGSLKNISKSKYERKE